MLPNEVFALACRAYYDEQGLIVDKTNGHFAHCPYPQGMGETGYYLLWEHHQHQGLLQSKDVGRCCFFVGHARRWLLTCDYWPDNYFELWDIYEEFTNSHLKEASAKAHKEKDSQGRSLLTLKLLADVHNEKTKDGKSKHAVNSGRRGGKGSHKDKNKEGKSKHGVRVGKKTHEEKDELGRSLHNLRLHQLKNSEGKSVVAVKAGKHGSEKTNSQVWQSTVDGYTSNAGAVACHNRARGWDPSARIRIS